MNLLLFCLTELMLRVKNCLQKTLMKKRRCILIEKEVPDSMKSLIIADA